MGPCELWVTVDEVAECCGFEDGSDTEPLESPTLAAVELLYVLEGRKHSGTCSRSVRPPGRTTCLGPWEHWDGSSWSTHGCRALSRVRLAGWARSITEVLLDGDVVDPATYDLRDHQWLVRVPDPADPNTALFWPSCQDMGLAPTEEGTFEVTYEYGVDVPEAGKLAAKELACSIYRTTCASNAGDLGACELPTGVVKIEREGITIELTGFQKWGRDEDGVWITGLPMVDAFLNAVNPQGQRKRSTIWSPDAPRFPRPVGTGS